MPDNKVLKESIQTALTAFEKKPLADASLEFFGTLGYRSERRLELKPNNAKQFQTQFDAGGRMNPEAALVIDWLSVDLLFQLTDTEIQHAANGVANMFASKKVDDKDIRSYLFFAVELKGKQYTRAQLAGVTREINKLFPMPVMVIFKYDKAVSLAIIARRINKKDGSKDVLEKVTLIKDIRFTGNRAQIEILHDLAISQLIQDHTISNFVDLQHAWEKTLDLNELNKKFYKEIANWYFWAVKTVKFPNPLPTSPKIQRADFRGGDEAERNAQNVIRLITRLIFVWFIKEKGLVPEELFDERWLKDSLKFEDPKKSTYYKAILQNLFFATLNTEMGEGRMFRRKNTGGLDPDYLMSNYYRYKHYFRNPEQGFKIFAGIPFLNGGLFECLDKEIEKGNVIRVDGFSDRDDNPLTVPDDLFLMEKEKEIDLNEIYDTKNKKYKVRGLIPIFNSYKFTIEENTPIEEEIALDPELLGKVFENLLAAYNPETGTTARKQTGSFYTPREIVNYMVDEALLAYLNAEGGSQSAEFEERLRDLLSYNPAAPDFTEDEKTRLIAAIDNVKVLDPACGSGAFPMGVLHKLVFILGKLDPDNERWKQKQIDNTKTSDSLVREAQIKVIDEIFSENHDDYGRKLYLIENCIYGVDIQPIAVQIAKLRFFISLVVDQKTNAKKPNLGIRPLPNLETKFVAANTLIGIQKPEAGTAMSFGDLLYKGKQDELKEVRKNHFSARTPAKKRMYRDLDKKLRGEISELLKRDGWGSESAQQLAGWDPYNQNAHADFFDPEWMFGVEGGFDVVIGNPPYISALEFSNIYGNDTRADLNARYYSARGSYDIFVLFIERGLLLTATRGSLVFITPNKYLSANYAVGLREFILSQYALVNLVDLSSIRVFEEAAVYPIVSVIRNAPEARIPINALLPKHRDIGVFDPLEFVNVEVQRSMLKLLPENIWGFLLSDKVDLLSKIVVGTSQLQNLGEVNATSTAGEADAYGQHITEKPSKDSVKIINTGTIDKWASLWGEGLMTHAGNRFSTPFLNLKKAEVNDRRREMYQSPKVIVAKMARVCEAFLDIEGEFASLNTNCFYKPKDDVSIKSIAAILNSTLFMFLYEQLFGALRMSGGYFQFQAPQLRVMPIKKPDTAQQKAIDKVVTKILAAKRAAPAGQVDTSALEGEIDQLVYQLYGLSQEEIDIVEGKK
jgi:hypothetical protein